VVPALPNNAELAAAEAELADAYRVYIDTVSSAGMAASLETMAFLLAFCRRSGIGSAVDFGSGFSSFVLRLWAAQTGATVWSVDTDPAWLKRTEQFLRDRDLNADGLLCWPQVPAAADLVFHDLAQGDLREQAMSTAVAVASRFVLFDDAHHAGHRRAMGDATAAANARIYNLRSLTVDPSKRFAQLSVK
jgi:predicted O-methyltransferase YrrM